MAGMWAAVLAAALFAGSAVTARRAIHQFGSGRANLFRLALATILLAAYAHTAGAGWRGPGFPWFIASGILGFGVCDTALYLALPRLGAPVAAMMTQCLSAPVAAIAEWLLWDGRLTPGEMGAAAVTVGGVAWALRPDPRATVNFDGAGAVLGLIAAVGQGLGAALSRHGQLVSRAKGFSVDGISVTYQRILAGIVVTAAWEFGRRGQVRFTDLSRRQLRAGVPFTVAATLCGPTLGVASYQAALQTVPAALVASVTSISPLLAFPLVWAMDGERPKARAVAGGAIAVAGVIALAWIRHRTA